jgi:oxygen-dependent protoporphyrinogen oxidase
MDKKIAIIGGGIAGLSAAYYLKKKGFSPTIFEASSQIGGVIQTKTIDGFTIESGPNTILLSDQRTVDMIDDLGLSIEDASPESKKRYIVKNGKCTALPMSLGSFISTPLFSFSTKFKILTEFLKRNKALGDEESISQFIIRRFGKEVLDYAINPFIAGTYAGDPDSLSIEHAFPQLYNAEQKHGSIIGGFFKERKNKNPFKIKRRTMSFLGGISTFTKKLAMQCKDSIFIQSQVTDVSKIDNGYTITFSQNNEVKSFICENIICTSPSHTLNKITIDGKPFQDFEALNSIYYPPVISVSLGYNSQDISHPLSGFGTLVPKCENMNILGVLFSSSLFKNRAPRGKSLLTVFMGGSRHPQHFELEKEERLSLIYKDLQKLLGINSEPIFVHETVWKKSIPQYHVGYGHYKSLLNMVEAKLPGFYFAGNYVNGISIQDTILTSMKLVNKKFKI